MDRATLPHAKSTILRCTPSVITMKQALQAIFNYQFLICTATVMLLLAKNIYQSLLISHMSHSLTVN